MSRIIAGSSKGRFFEVPKGDNTRPTTERVREALFSALASWLGTADEAVDEHLDGVAVLDLFGGSGAIALESMSRGASRAVSVEADAPTARLIRDNSRSTGLAVEVVAGKLPGALAQATGRFDVVFIDPPYDLAPERVDELLAALVDGDKLLPRALVVLERSKRTPDPAWPPAFTETWEKRYGETILHFGTTD